MLTPVRTASSIPVTPTPSAPTESAMATSPAGTASSSTSAGNADTRTAASTTTSTPATATASANTAAGTNSETDPASTTDSAPASPLSGGRYGLLSLSGQLQVAQGVSAIADAIGQALQMPRAENEALQDYAVRLASAVSAMTPDERTALEGTINQSVSGASLRMLADLLRNPAGPDAARLTAYLEAALTDGTDPDQVMRAVLSAYQQNTASDGATARPALPTAIGVPPATVPLANPPAAVTLAALSAAMAAGDAVPDEQAALARSAAPGLNGNGIIAGQDGDAAQPASGAAGMIGAGNRAPGTLSTNPPGTAMAAAAPGESPMASPALRPDGSLAGDPAKAAAAAMSGNAGAGNAGQALAGAAMPLASSAEAIAQQAAGRTPTVPPALTPVDDFDIQDPLPVSAGEGLAGRTIGRTNLSLVLASSPDTLATIEWLATALAGNTLPALISALAAHGRTSAVDDFIARLIAGGLLGGLAMSTTDTAQLLAQARAIAAPPDPQTTGSTARDPDLPQMLADARPHGQTPARREAEGLPLPLSPQMQAAQAREGFVFPYVTYPPLDQPPQRRPKRPTIEISAVDEDGEHPHEPGEQAFSDDGQGADGEGGSEDHGSAKLEADNVADAAKAGTVADSPELDAASATKPKAPGKREAPTAHLADHDDDLPQDFYFRMAGWK